MVMSFCIFFFFQAEDGIRDVAVTGVQTCALPIYRPGGERGPDRDAAFEAKRRAAARRTHRDVRDIAADRVTDERDEGAVLRPGGGDEVVRMQRGGRVRAGCAAEEERVLAGREDEELGDLIAEALCVEGGGAQRQRQETPQPASHRSSEPGMSDLVGSKRRRAWDCVNPARRSERGPVALPLRLLLPEEGDEARIAADVVQERITLEQRVAGEPTLGGLA